MKVKVLTQNGYVDIVINAETTVGEFKLQMMKFSLAKDITFSPKLKLFNSHELTIINSDKKNDACKLLQLYKERTGQALTEEGVNIRVIFELSLRFNTKKSISNPMLEIFPQPSFQEEDDEEDLLDAKPAASRSNPSLLRAKSTLWKNSLQNMSLAGISEDQETETMPTPAS